MSEEYEELKTYLLMDNWVESKAFYLLAGCNPEIIRHTSGLKRTEIKLLKEGYTVSSNGQGSKSSEKYEHCY